MKKLLFISFLFLLSSCYGIEQHVAEEAIKEYNIVKENSGSDIDLSVRAALVAEAYLQAKDNENYKKWKAIEKEHSKSAGIDF